MQFLSMKLGALNPQLEINTDNFFEKEVRMKSLFVISPLLIDPPP